MIDYKQQNKVSGWALLRALAYASGQMLLGLLLHPYRSVQLMHKHRLLSLFVLYPLLIGLFNHGLPWPQSLSIVQDVVFFFCLYWQLVLLYLWLRFSLLLGQSNHDH